ncbi:MAG: hypothetical protein UT30_C0031G0004 [Candidatus Uhrbacteria bacterium GW2011_GWF2_39_13]|uniref:Uncharacterized protein n=1 Tax=Candidatus Uhrbacteria bacterium GW2011_GWF2_39_13 TaxID=1618995 RepID=A0A0G0MJN0_9BACT|nr:MAG: hypothetical protein UT30_C0031G0004 [Candidatus Uhrbacteria bacterium GW2011_GWF2_39_13]
MCYLFPCECFPWLPLTGQKTRTSWLLPALTAAFHNFLDNKGKKSESFIFIKMIPLEKRKLTIHIF